MLFVWLTRRVWSHYGITYFIYLFVNESRAPVTWSSVVAILVVSVVSSSFFRWSFREWVLLPEANTPRLGLWYKCSFWKSFYALMHSTRKLRTISLIYRWGLHHWEFKSVWKWLKPPESVIKWNRLYCTCIFLHCWEFTKHIWKGLLLFQDQNDKRKYGDLDWTRSRIGCHDNFVVKTKDILSRFKDHFRSVNTSY